MDREIRKRKLDGKETAFSINGRQLTRQKIQKELARHVHNSYGGPSQEIPKPDNVQVFTPPSEIQPGNTIGIFFDNLPWFQFQREIQRIYGFYEVRSKHTTAPRTSWPPIGNTMSSSSSIHDGMNFNPKMNAFSRYLTQPTKNIPESFKVSLFSDLSWGRNWTINDIMTHFLPISDWGQSNGLRQNSDTMTPLSSSHHPLSVFVFLVTNNLIDDTQLQTFYEWIMTNVGSEALRLLCQLRISSMKVFARRILLCAVRSGNIVLAQRLIALGASVGKGAPGYRRDSPLSVAVRRRHLQMVEILCNAGAAIEIRGQDVISHKDHRSLWEPEYGAILQTLLSSGGHPERFVIDRDPGFPLVDAALAGSLESVRLLLGSGARLNCYVPAYFGTALQSATGRQHENLVRYLILHGADVNAPDGCFYQHIWESNSGASSWLSSRSYAATSALKTPIQIAAENDDINLVQLLLGNGAFASSCPIFGNARFIESRSYDLIWRISSGYGPRYAEGERGYTALQYAIQNQSIELVTFLLCNGADANIGSIFCDSPLQMSARLGNSVIAKLLLDAGADVHAFPALYNGRTAIQAAAECGCLPLVLMLLQANASLNAPAGEKQGMTALQVAAYHGHVSMVGFLLASGAEINAPPASVAGFTALQAAAEKGDSRLLEDFISLGADVNAPGSWAGRTALQEASAIGWFDGAKRLLEYGARANDNPTPGPISCECFNALGFAIEAGSYELVELLLHHGADVHAPIGIVEEESLYPLPYALSLARGLGIAALLLERFDWSSHAIELESPLEAAVDGLNLDEDNIKLVEVLLVEISALPRPLKAGHIRKALSVLPLELDTDNVDEMTLKVLNTLLAAGADINSRCERTRSSLLQRTAGLYPKTAKLLLCNGAEVNVPATLSLGTPLQEAIKGSEFGIVESLLQTGAELNAPPAKNSGMTALQAASVNCSIPLVIRLLEKGAKVSAAAAPVGGRTAIDGAAEHGRCDVLQLLLNSYDGQDSLGAVCNTAAYFAEKEGHTEAAHWLRSYTKVSYLKVLEGILQELNSGTIQSGN